MEVDVTTGIERDSLALLTDLYQLTMAYGHWKLRTDREAVFHLSYRTQPFKGGFAVACGLASVLDYLDRLRFDASDRSYLATLTGADGKPLFEQAFLDYLGDLKLTCDIDAVPEGTVVFPHEPLVRVSGPLIECQLLETALLNLVNFQTLIATKAARVCLAAKGDAVLEFGLRRAQGVDGGLTASRSAYVGGCAATSNVLAGKVFGIPVKGTHAHSWVMAFDSEPEAFEAYAEALPNNCVFLVDTYDTLEGVRHAIAAGRRLRERGHDLLGIRLDSGDLAWLSIEARKLLDEAGFPKAQIVASNDLDEHLIQSLKEQGAQIAVWGVGTKLATAFDQPAFGGVYKLSAVRERGGAWQDRVKLSEQTEKVSIPGILQTRRYTAGGEFVADVIHRVDAPPAPGSLMIDPLDLTRRRPIPEHATHEDLLVPVYRSGRRVYESPDLKAIRARTLDQLSRLHFGIKRFTNPHRYPVGLEEGLFDLRTRLVLKARGVA
jgi:nicotinate phosphoribosyltransferase